MRKSIWVGVCLAIGSIATVLTDSSVASAQEAPEVNETVEVETEPKKEDKKEKVKSIELIYEETTLEVLMMRLHQDFGIAVYVRGNWTEKFSINAAGIDQATALKIIRDKAASYNAEIVEEDGLLTLQSAGKHQYVFSKRSNTEDASNRYAKVKDGEIQKDTRRLFGDIYFRPFLPKTRYYFDTGSDDENEVDIFKNGSLAPAVDFINIFYPLNLNPQKGLGKYIGDDWLFGPAIGLGITTPASGVDDAGNSVNSSAPVVLLSGGLELDIPVGKRDDEDGGEPNYIAVEVGYAHGISTDEELDNIDDGAVYVGLGFSWKQSKLKF